MAEHSLRKILQRANKRPALQSDLLWIYRGRGVPTTKWSVPTQVPVSILFVEAGSITFEWEGQNLTCHAGDLFLAGTCVRRNRSTPGTKLLSVGYDFAWPSGMTVFGDGLNRKIAGAMQQKAGRELFDASVRLYQRIHPNAEELTFQEAIWRDRADLASYVERQAAFWEWLTVLLRAYKQLRVKARLPQVRRSPVREAKQLLDEVPLDQPFSFARPHEQLSVSWRRVEQLFKEEMHLTPRQYLEQRRVAQAKLRLRQPQASVKEVASELGFSSLSRFSNWFSSHTGYSPRFFQGHG